MVEDKEPVKERMVINWIRVDQHDRFATYCRERQLKWNAGLQALLNEAEMYRSLIPFLGEIMKRLDGIELRLEEGESEPEATEIKTFGGQTFPIDED